MSSESNYQAVLFPNLREDNATGRKPVNDTKSPFGKYLLGLARIKGIGSVALRALMDSFDNLESVWESEEEDISSALEIAHVPKARHLAKEIVDKRTYFLQEGESELADMERRGIQVLGRHHAGFPEQFCSLQQPPYWLFVDGDLRSVASLPLIAIVGTRDASRHGLRATQTATFAAAEAGFGLVSGLAEGIDAAAHEIAARYRMPQIGVLGTGIHVIFPRSTAHLRREIVETGGAVISEFLPTENYGRSQFVARNRLQAALASVVAPIEGTTSSGTAHTLRFAKELGKQVVGITHGEVAESNSIHGQLVATGCLTYNLMKASEREEFKHFLAEVPGTRWKGFRRPDPEILYRRVRKAWQEMTSFIEATEEERLQLARQFMTDLDLLDHELVRRNDC